MRRSDWFFFGGMATYFVVGLIALLTGFATVEVVQIVWLAIMAAPLVRPRFARFVGIDRFGGLMPNDPASWPGDGLRRNWPETHKTFRMGDTVRKVRGSQWHGRVVGQYSTELTPEGYAVESDTERGSVQIYPASALERAA